jgi:hypothetical protein
LSIHGSGDELAQKVVARPEAVIGLPLLHKPAVPYSTSPDVVRLRHFLGGALHLARHVDDPISKTSATIDEYCARNRVVTVRGSKVTIADYEAQQLTEIHHAAQTWSVTSFADIARPRMDLYVRMGTKTPAGVAKVTALGRAATGARGM